MATEAALSFSTSASRPDRICLLSPQDGNGNLLGKNYVRVSSGKKQSVTVGTARSDSDPLTLSDSKPSSAFRLDRSAIASSQLQNNERLLGDNEVIRIVADTRPEDRQEKIQSAFLPCDVIGYRGAPSRGSIALHTLDVYLHLASRICDEVDSAFRACNSKKPLRLSSTSWDLLD